MFDLSAMQKNAVELKIFYWLIARRLCSVWPGHVISVR